jgi:anti-anti-sigma factor
MLGPRASPESTSEYGLAMSFDLNIRKVEDVVIMDFSGRFTIGEPVTIFREAVRLQLEEGARKFVWNLGVVDSIDSAGLGAIVSAYAIVRTKGGDAKIVLRQDDEGPMPSL